MLVLNAAHHYRLLMDAAGKYGSSASVNIHLHRPSRDYRALRSYSKPLKDGFQGVYLGEVVSSDWKFIPSIHPRIFVEDEASLMRYSRLTKESIYLYCQQLYGFYCQVTINCNVFLISILSIMWYTLNNNILNNYAMIMHWTITLDSLSS